MSVLQRIFKKRIAANLALCAAALVVVAVAVELSLRLFFPVQYRQPPRPLPGDVWRELLHRPSAVPGLAYELAPNHEKTANGILIQTNSYGMRDGEPRPPQDESARRVVVAGDSFTFGFGVAGAETYPNVLERLLNENITGAPFEVLNLGVGGYSTRDEALALEHKGLLWKPELIVVGYVLNDPEIDPVEPLHSHYQDPRWWQHSHLLRLLAQIKIIYDIERLGDGDYSRYLHADRRKWQGVVEGLRRMSGLARERDTPILLVIFPMTGKPWVQYPYRDLHQKVAACAKENGLNVLDLYDRFAAHPPSALTVAPGDSHPNKFGHELAAQAIYQWLRETGRLLAIPSASDRQN